MTMEYEKQIEKLTDAIFQFARGQFGIEKVFEDLLVYIIHGFSPMAEPLGKERWPYTREQNAWFMDRLVELCEIVNEAKAKGELVDVFGAMYMSIAARGHKSLLGQFFTPPLLADMLSKMVGAEEEKRKTIADPTCGSGVMLLASAKDNPDIVVYGNDIDAICVKMCVCNLVLNGVRGIVTRGDSLSNVYRDGYIVNHISVEGERVSYIRRLTGEEATAVWIRNTKPVRQNRVTL